MSKNVIRIENNALSDMLERFERAGHDLNALVQENLVEYATEIGQETYDAVQKPNLPRAGKYSKGHTQKSVILNPRPIWKGSVCEIKAGFDYDKKGAGGFLISGTPKQAPVKKLNDMYKRANYSKKLTNKYIKQLKEKITKILEG